MKRRGFLAAIVGGLASLALPWKAGAAVSPVLGRIVSHTVVTGSMRITSDFLAQYTTDMEIRYTWPLPLDALNGRVPTLEGFSPQTMSGFHVVHVDVVRNLRPTMQMVDGRLEPVYLIKYKAVHEQIPGA